jgi:TonB family protein
LHERAHIRRRDLPVHFATHVVACLWWFQPMVWVLRSKLRAESEYACDAEVLRSGLRPSEYASELLCVARFAQEAYVPASAMSMLQPAHLEKRLRSILYPSAGPVSLKRTVSLALALAAASCLASGVTVTRININPKGGFAMKRVLISALFSAAGLSAATISGTVHDASGAAIADGAITLTNLDNLTQLQASTDAEGKFSLESGVPGPYILHVVKTGYSPIYCEFNANGQSDFTSDFTMPAEGSPVPDSASGQKGVRVGGAVAQNNLTYKAMPSYPVQAKQNRIQGTVEIRASISKEGVPQELRVVSSPDDDLSTSALQAVRQWRYRPTLLNGEPVAISTTVIVNYTLSN